ncbi:MAG: ferrochelatase [Deltaproteobacteria bacterium]|jgi:ferrochelatase|nr:ferrochelatase [Deltaproteobacteria bacterium]MBW2535501.1 ferrochelatase [Deltaproteobacteria bacterium]
MTDAAAATTSTTLLLVNMGGPGSAAEVEPYLRAIFADPAILQVPSLIRGPLGRFIARRRAPRVAERYQRIGGGSPLARWTVAQEETTRAALGRAGASIGVEHAFRYTAPLVDEALAAMHAQGTRRVILLPLFPHHTDAMTGSILREAHRAAEPRGLELQVVDAFGAREDVLALWGEMLDEALAQAGRGARVLFVAHGIPQRNVRRGEDYPDRVRDTAGALAARLDRSTSWSVAFQSRVGPVRWTEPYLESELARLAASSAPVVLMPVSFVADCLETLFDLDEVAAAELRTAGVTEVVRVPAFNDLPAFGGCLASMALEAAAAAGWTESLIRASEEH